jgi:hypothetical protein
LKLATISSAEVENGGVIPPLPDMYMSRDSSVAIARDYGTSRAPFQAVQDFSLLHSVQTGCRAHPASYPMGTGGTFPRDNRPECEAGHSPPSNAEVENGGAILPLPHVFMA